MDSDNKADGYYNDKRLEMLEFLADTAEKVLDIGCGNGFFSRLIKETNNAEEWGIELMQ